MSRQSAYWAVAVAWLWAGCATADEALKARFLREAPVGWRRLRESEQHVVGLLHTETWALNAGKRNEKWGRDSYAKIQRNGDMLSRTSFRELRTVVLAANPRYSFQVERESEHAPFVLRYLSFDPFPTRLDEVENVTHLLSLLGSPHRLFGTPLEDLIVQPGFVLGHVSESAEETTPAVRVEFEYSSAERKMDRRSGRMTFIPSANWALQAAEYDPRKDWHETIRNEYRPNRDGRHALYRVQRFHRFSEHKVEENYQYTFDELEDRLVPESAFTLTEFGLPEPSETVSPHRGTRLHYWLIGGALALFATAVALRRAARR